MCCGCTDGHGTREHGAERTTGAGRLVFSGTYATDEHTIEIELELCSRCDLSDRIWSRSGTDVVVVVGWLAAASLSEQARSRRAIQSVRVVWERESESASEQRESMECGSYFAEQQKSARESENQQRRRHTSRVDRYPAQVRLCDFVRRWRPFGLCSTT